jgi:hypothetical protein
MDILLNIWPISSQIPITKNKENELLQNEKDQKSQQLNVMHDPGLDHRLGEN